MILDILGLFLIIPFLASIFWISTKIIHLWEGITAIIDFYIQEVVL